MRGAQSGKDLAEQTDCGCPERGSNCNLLLAGKGLREGKVGNIDASDKENKSHRSQKNQKCGPHIPYQIVMQG